MIQKVINTIRPLVENETEMPPAAQGSLLIVDDNGINRDVLSRRLARQGHHVAVAENGPQALELLLN